jgi:peptidyl-tRNA hydrolase, PTH1 family
MADTHAPRLIVGLGNPGTEYENTYHNAGAQALAAIAATLGKSDEMRWNGYKKLFSYAQIPGWIFLKPCSFMNTSGGGVRAAAKKFKTPPDRIILLHDDSDLPLGTWKMSRGRGAAGHHGVESAMAALGTNDFFRIRIGIRPAHERVRGKAGTFVLKPVTNSARAILKKTFAEIAAALAEKNCDA